MGKVKPYLFIIVALLITIVLWLLSKNSLSDLTIAPWRTVTQFAALIGMVLMAFTLLLATRFRFLESLFGGLDRDYKAHALLGSLSFLLLMMHPISLVINVIPNYSLALRYFIPWTALPFDLG